MNLDIQLSHLAAMDSAIATLMAFDCGPTAVAALITLSTAIAEVRLALTEQLMTWLNTHYELFEA
jgi:hypothetical protein